jgi:hypothetical protein
LDGVARSVRLLLHSLHASLYKSYSAGSVRDRADRVQNKASVPEIIWRDGGKMGRGPRRLIQPVLRLRWVVSTCSWLNDVINLDID